MDHDARSLIQAQSLPPDWLDTLRRYLVFIAIAHLVWELAHLPLYTSWETQTHIGLAVAAMRAAGGDVLIALSSVVLALLLIGHRNWPAHGFRKVALLTIAFGLSYTVFSEWLNVEMHEAWAYRDIMPVIPVTHTGLSPVLQWIVVPVAAFWWICPPRVAGTEQENFV